MTAPISLSDLAALERSMTGGEWRNTNDIQLCLVYIESQIVCRVNLSNDDATDQEHANAAGICAARNALPALIEIAKAAHALLEDHDAEYDSRQEGRLREALGKVTP